MKALVLRENSFQIEDFELPELKTGEVKVKITAAALNHRDVFIRDGQYAKIQYPAILGSDACGEVVDVKESYDSHLIGKKVIINPNNEWGSSDEAQSRKYHILGMPGYGAFAEYLHVQADRVHEKPEHLSDEEAAALPLAGMTAYRALIRQGELEEAGRNVLITGIGGGVALFAFQFARALDANIFVTSGSDEKITDAIRMGASGGANYRNPECEKELLGKAGHFDIIVDGTGGAQMNMLLNLVRPGGTIVCYGATLGPVDKFALARIFWKQITLRGSTMASDEEFGDMLRFVERYEIRPIVDSVVPFGEIISAFDTMKNAKQFGKLVVSFGQ